MSPKVFIARTLPDLLMRRRNVFATLANVLVISASYTAAFLLRFDISIPAFFRPIFLITLPAVIAIHFGALHLFHLTRGWWRYVGLSDFVNAVKAAVVAAVVLAAYVMFVHRGDTYPRSVFLINAVLFVGFSIGMRLIVRLLRQVPLDTVDRRRLLIIGAGDTGEALLREIRHGGRLNYQVVAFLDDDQAKIGSFINGVPVSGEIAAAAEVAERLRADEIVVATPSASGEEMRAIIGHCRAAKVPFKVIPATWELLDGTVGLNMAREVDINDLLRRPPVELDMISIGRFLKGKRVLVTGAAGSIGSEICRQLLGVGPSMLICLDHDENALFYLERSLSGLRADVDIRYKLLDITDVPHLTTLFEECRPEVVYHAAAHKHVPMIEANPVEGVRNNLFGTEAVATLAGRHDVEAFVLISTDKAVNPSSVMGATKRAAELLLQTLPFKTRYTAVRFGNVLGSQGSVVPLLKEQIARGGPVTVTHPDMRRFFMTIPEAVQLVIQASAMGTGTEVFMLDMGEPVKIVDLATDLITLSGLRPGVDVQITFTGVRPGEKLYEELYLEAEDADRTRHPKILIARQGQLAREKYLALVEEMRRAVEATDLPAVRQLIPRLVPEYGKKTASGNVIPISAARRS